MATYKVLYWRDIPAQGKADNRPKPLSSPLPERYQVAIDRIAMKEGLAGSDAYLDLWKWSPRVERAGSAAEVLTEVLAELQAEWDPKL